MTKKKGGGKPQVNNQGLVMMNFQVPPKLYQQFKLRVNRDRVTIRAVAEALLTAYLKGELSHVEEKKTDAEGA